ncbi:PREDICTED: putative ATP-dependent RNA helicase TDRD12 [Dufourea novaeangliae]|uniref:putative ATP-dependent RNA helicase TDRD12 n=1 Tax=Dufourea novaeangliae TaxID=178035 RepID=UPI000766E1DF|nr:PREDICTED: putative ATP-dependent RNA helicase TDRD12 [Dufourea novaeangliae]
MKNESFDSKGIILPSTAVAIKVTNILTPYFIRICKRKDYEKKLNLINNKLLLLRKRGIFNKDTNHAEPKIGDVIIVCDKFKNVNLPAWLCRGIISNVLNDTENIYNVFLSDYGISVELHRDDFFISSTGLIVEEYLSSTVGLYNVLPTVLKHNSSVEGNTSLLVLQEWSESAVQYTKELIVASSAIYFDHLASDECGRQYGEFYLNIEDTLIRLSEALILNNHAIYIQEDIMKFIEDPKNCEKLHKEVVNDETIYYMNILKEYKREHEFDIHNESYIRTRNKFKVKQRSHSDLRKGKEKVLIYGRNKYECLGTISDLRFPTEIHKAWKSLINSSSPTKIQSYILPAIKNGLDVIAIGAAKSGKTYGYVLAVCGLLASKLNLPQGVNPVALILCSSSSEVLEVSSLCTEFLQNYKTIRCVAAINGKSERSLVAEMFNGCQILVSTPRFITRFMDENRKLLNFENLRCLILDDGDVILEKYFDSIGKLFKKHKIICNRELKHANVTLQIIVTAKHWTPQIKKLATILMDYPYICVASFIEATVFKSVHPKMYIVNTKSKDKKVLDLLGNKCSTLRTIIVCTDSDEAKTLHKVLEQSNKDILLVHDNTNFVHLQGIKQYWDACVNDSYPVLICTDEVLSELNITNAMWLIHYSISLRWKTQFNFRFSTLYDSLQEQKPRCKVSIIVDENSDIQFLSIISILQRMNVVIPRNILDTIEHTEAMLEKNKENYPMCNNMKLWGFCHKKYSCALRHRIISEIDTPTIDIRIFDKVKFRVVSIHSVTQISARIISYIKHDTLEEIEFSNVEYMQITMKIQEFYSCVDNRRRCETIDVGSICGLEEPVDSFKRVQILHIEREDKTDKPKYADVRCIDNGVLLTKVNVYRLLHMPEEFRKYPTQVIEVFLAGIAPYDNEYVWNHCAIDAVFQWFKENIDERSYVIGTVNLHLKNTIWVNTLEVGTKLIGYKDIVGSSLKTELLRSDHAVENLKHLKEMYQLCKDAGLSEINGCNLDVLINKQA